MPRRTNSHSIQRLWGALRGALLALLIFSPVIAHTSDPAHPLCAALLADIRAVGQANSDWAERPLDVGGDMWKLAEFMASVEPDEADIDPLNGTDIRAFPDLFPEAGPDLHRALERIEGQGGTILWSMDPKAYSLFDVQFDSSGRARAMIQLVELKRLRHELEHFAQWERRLVQAAAVAHAPGLLRVIYSLSDTPLGRFYDEQGAVLLDLTSDQLGMRTHLFVQTALESFLYPYVESIRIGLIAEKYLNRRPPSETRTRLKKINNEQMRLLVERFSAQYAALVKRIVDTAEAELQAQGFNQSADAYDQWVESDPQGSDEELPSELAMAHLYALFNEGLEDTFRDCVEDQVGEKDAIEVLKVFHRYSKK